MEQRMYHGNINPDALADYLVNMFNHHHDLRERWYVPAVVKL